MDNTWRKIHSNSNNNSDNNSTSDDSGTHSQNDYNNNKNSNENSKSEAAFQGYPFKMLRGLCLTEGETCQDETPALCHEILIQNEDNISDSNITESAQQYENNKFLLYWYSN